MNSCSLILIFKEFLVTSYINALEHNKKEYAMRCVHAINALHKQKKNIPINVMRCVFAIILLTMKRRRSCWYFLDHAAAAAAAERDFLVFPIAPQLVPL